MLKFFYEKVFEFFAGFDLQAKMLFLFFFKIFTKNVPQML